LDDADHHIVYEFGWAGDRSRAEGLHPRGATVSGGVLRKKPWRFSSKFEFMAGMGPARIHGSARQQAIGGAGQDPTTDP
jgi:hypothetical protein